MDSDLAPAGSPRTPATAPAPRSGSALAHPSRGGPARTGDSRPSRERRTAAPPRAPGEPGGRLPSQDRLPRWILH
jgi:hypothetical protein